MRAPTKSWPCAFADSKAWDSTGNLLIKGDNPDALKLLRQSYRPGQAHLHRPALQHQERRVYLPRRLHRLPDRHPDHGYSADNVEYIQNIYGARTHSGWLSFMYPRLLLAKDLVMRRWGDFISIDDNEQAQLAMLCDEVFGQDAFAGKFPGGNAQQKAMCHTVYPKTTNGFFAQSPNSWLTTARKGVLHDTRLSNDRWRIDLTKQTKASDQKILRSIWSIPKLAMCIHST
ncbi:MAG: DNA methyltransferase [Paenacidovorax caeni]